MVGWGHPNQVSASKHAFEEINVNEQVTVLYQYWVLKSWLATMLLLVKPANHACPKPNYTLESQNTWGAVQIYCISLLWSWKVMLLVGDPYDFWAPSGTAGPQSGGNVQMQTRLSSNVCGFAGWSTPAASDGQTVYTWILKCFEKASAQEGLWPSPAPLLSRTMLNKWTRLMVVAKSLF